MGIKLRICHLEISKPKIKNNEIEEDEKWMFS